MAETKRYDAQKNINFELFMIDFNIFNVVLILTRYQSLARSRMFWEKEEDNGILLKHWVRNTFDTFETNLNFADNDHLKTANKVHLLYNIANKNIQWFWLFHSFYSIDEQMYPSIFIISVFHYYNIDYNYKCLTLITILLLWFWNYRKMCWFGSTCYHLLPFLMSNEISYFICIIYMRLSFSKLV